jgi:hypothetical protein
MSATLEPDAAMDDRSFDRFRVPDTGLCWWCGNPADSAEHKFKASDLRRIAGPTEEAGNVYNSSGHHQRGLNSLRKGPQIRWGQNLCKRCNNQTSQPFDRAYDKFVEFMLAHFDAVHRHRGIDWTDIYGQGWQQGVRHLSCYLVKQFGCMMATAKLPVPQDAIDFLDGTPHVGSILVLPFRDWRAIELHKLTLKDDSSGDGMEPFIGLPATHFYETEGRLSGADYVLRLGYLVLRVEWRDGAESVSMHDERRISMPLLNADRPSRREWRRMTTPVR